MSVTIAIIAPLGLALYWLMNNVLMIIERLVLNKYLNKEEEAEGKCLIVLFQKEKLQMKQLKMG